MKFNKLLLAVLAGSLFIVSCSSDDKTSNDAEVITTPGTSDTISGKYKGGIFVVNEGNSNVSSATVTFVDKDGNAEQDIYNNINPGKPALGSYLQSMFFSNERAYIISGQANKITVVNRYTFEFIATIDSNLSSPRYGAVIGNKAYVTNYADFNIGNDDFLTVINLDDFSTSKIGLNNWSERITAINNKLYISNGFFGNGASLTVFNPATSSTEKVIELGISPNSMQQEHGNLYVVGDNKLINVDLSDDQVEAVVNLPQGVTDARNIDVENGNIYFTNQTTVYKINNGGDMAMPLFTYQSDSPDGGMYGFAVKNDNIYIAEGGNFSSDSEIYIYTLTGSRLKTIPAGVGPNGFYFNN